MSVEPKNSSLNLLKSLDRIKSEEFGDEISQLDEFLPNENTIETAVTTKDAAKTTLRDKTNIPTPKTQSKSKFDEISESIEVVTSVNETPKRRYKRKYDKISEHPGVKTPLKNESFKGRYDEEAAPSKKPKLDEEDIESSRIDVFTHRKKLSEEELEAKHKAKLEYVQQFVNISVHYSQFLETKIEGKKVKGEVANTSSNKKESPDVMKQMKFFEGGTLRSYQVEGVTWLTVLYETGINGILADEMGLGKTIQVIALFCHLYERQVKGPFMIVAPLSTLGNWQSEFEKFAPKLPVIRLQGNCQERQDQMKLINKMYTLDDKKVQPVVLCSYQTPQYEEGFLQRFVWRYIVVDEAQRIKNPESKLSLELRALRSENRLLLTGTPLQNNIRELWALFNFLMPELFKDIEKFSTLLELEDMMDKDKILENEAKTQIISTIHKVLAPFMLRREKKTVLSDIVPKKEVIIYCPLTELQKYIYRAILKKDVDKLMMRKPKQENVGRGKRKCTMKKISYRYDKKDSFDIEDDDISKEIVATVSTPKEVVFPDPENLPVGCPNCSYYCRLTMQNLTMMMIKTVNHPYLIWYPLNPNLKKRELYVGEDLIANSGKLMVLDSLLPKLKAGGHKVLIFSTLVMFMDMIEELLIMRGYNYRRFDGETDFDQRNHAINDFMNDPSVFVFLLSTRSGGLGLNLTAADTVIFMDRDWNPMADLQAQDRCHRIGQTKPVMIYSLIVKNTVDEIIVMRGDMKKRLEKIVIQEGKFMTLKHMPTDDELRELEQLLNNEEELTKVHANGLIYTDEELDKILDRSELYDVMKK